MRVLILGGQGMLGHKVFQTVRSRFDTFATFRTGGGPWTEFPMYRDKTHTLAGVDAFRFDSVVQAFSQVKPDVVINCIGVIKQLDMAKNPIISLELNALYPHRLAELCLATDTRLLHLSTDCVFSGKKGNYSESDTPDATDLYGRTKLLGEVNQPHCLTLRTSVIGRDFLKDVGLLEWFLSNEGQQIKGFTQAIYSGFTTQALAGIMADIIADYPELSGIYHVASRPISKYELLTRIRDAAGLAIDIEPSAEFYCDRSLDASRFVAATGYDIPAWDEMIAELVADSTPYDEWRRKHGITGR